MIFTSGIYIYFFAINVIIHSTNINTLIYSTHVLTEDTVSTEVKNGKLYYKQLLTKTNRLSKWNERFISLHKKFGIYQSYGK